jgi:hypothetical protein
MRIMLVTDSNDNIEAVTFNVAPTALPFVADYEVPLPTDLRCAIYGFQVNLVGPGNGAHTTFTSAGGILTYQTIDALAVQKTNTCGGKQDGTAETSNSVYGDVLTASSDNLCQWIGHA